MRAYSLTLSIKTRTERNTSASCPFPCKHAYFNTLRF